MMSVNIVSFTQPLYPILILAAVSVLVLAILDLMLIRKTGHGLPAFSKSRE
ncbi:MAG TPA: hypothetical protein VFY68_02495 [Nitrososphaeraceae archaeon]|nr:hypothetical protein [Nitrososphaeraceae archaeon]